MSHDGAVLWLGGTSSTGSITCLRNTDSRNQSIAERRQCNNNSTAGFGPIALDQTTTE